MKDNTSTSSEFTLQDGDVEKVKVITDTLLSKMGLSFEFTVSVISEDQAILIDLNPGDSAGLIIGKKGETLFSLQSIIGLIFKAENDRKVRILTNVADWREKQNNRLIDLADQTASHAIESGAPQNLYNLTPGQRRIIHTHLSNNTSVKTESAGDGRDRYLIVSPNVK